MIAVGKSVAKTDFKAVKVAVKSAVALCINAVTPIAKFSLLAKIGKSEFENAKTALKPVTATFTPAKTPTAFNAEFAKFAKFCD